MAIENGDSLDGVSDGSAIGCCRGHVCLTFDGISAMAIGGFRPASPSVQRSFFLMTQDLAAVVPASAWRHLRWCSPACFWRWRVRWGPGLLLSLMLLSSLWLVPSGPLLSQSVVAAEPAACLTLTAATIPIRWSWAATASDTASPSDATNAGFNPLLRFPASSLQAPMAGPALRPALITADQDIPIRVTMASPANTSPATTQTNPSTKPDLPSAVTNTSTPAIDRLCAYAFERGQALTTLHPLALRPIQATNSEALLQAQVDAALPVAIRRPLQMLLQIESADRSIIKNLPGPAQSVVLVTSRWLCALISTVFLITVYLFLATAIHAYYCPRSKFIKTIRSTGLRILDPALVSASDYGTASLANLQILWFTLIVTWLITNGWLMTGELLNPSSSLLGLLGISGGVNVLGKSIGINQQRIPLPQWNWLVEHRFLKRACDVDPFHVAQWRDFVNNAGVLDPSRYQLLIFGFLIGITLLLGDPAALETYQVPSFFIALQGVSGSLYLFGKAASSNGKDEFQAQLEAWMQRGIQSLTLDDRKAIARNIESLYGQQALGSEASRLRRHPALA